MQNEKVLGFSFASWMGIRRKWIICVEQFYMKSVTVGHVMPWNCPRTKIAFSSWLENYDKISQSVCWPTGGCVYAIIFECTCIYRKNIVYDNVCMYVCTYGSIICILLCTTMQCLYGVTISMVLISENNLFLLIMIF